MRAGFYTLGCKLSQCESEALASAFGSQGFSVFSAMDGADEQGTDVYIISTCTVTSKAEQKARRVIRKLSREHPASSVIVTGCYAQLNRSDIEALGENVVVVPQEEKHILLSLPAAAAAAFSSGNFSSDFLRSWARGARGGDVFSFTSAEQHFHSRGFLKIQDGCNNRCAYCRVPLARGNSVSLPLAEVKERALSLALAGYREIVLTGINISAYRDVTFDLADCVDTLTGALPGVRLRLSSLEPDQVDERLAGALSHEAVCPHFHIPVQSGSDRVLKHAGRHYLASGVVETVLRLRKAKPDAFLAADIIVGLPGESDEDFADTLSLVGELKFAQLHVFPFSARPGTAFFKAKNLVPERIAGERAASLRALSSSLHAAYTSGFKGRVLKVLLEEENGDIRSGLSENYLRVSVKDVPRSVKQGMIVPVLVGRTSPGLAGRYQQVFEKLQ